MNGNIHIRLSTTYHEIEERNDVHQDTVHVTSSDMSSTNQTLYLHEISEDRVHESLDTMNDPTISIIIDSHSH